MGIKAILPATPHGLDDLSDRALFGEGCVDNDKATTGEVRKTFRSGAVRNSGGKLRYDLIPYEHTREMAKVLTMGEEKYSARNWERGIPFSELYAAGMRHLQLWLGGETHDKDSGLLHLSHAAWNIMALEVMVLRGKGGELDDLTAGNDEIAS